MDLPGQGIPYWIASTPSTDYPPQEGDIEVEVAVLGAGIAGVTAASLLKAAGARVAVIEARRALIGVTGHTTAKLTSLHGLIYRRLVEQFDRERAYLYGQANQAAIDWVADTVQQHKIACDFARTAAYTYTVQDDRREVEAETEMAQSLGLPATFEEDVPLPYKVRGAVRFGGQARFHPRRFLLALLSEIPGDGSVVLEETTAIEVNEGRPLVVRTNRGQVRAQNVIVATHFPFLDRGLYFGRQTPQRSYALGVRLAGPAPEGMFISTRPDMHSIRSQPIDEGALLIIGGGEHPTGQSNDTRIYYRELEQWVRQHWDVQSIDYHWSTQDNYPIDGLPFIGKYTPSSSRLFVATGFMGWGMSNGVVAGMLLSDLILGRPNPWTAVYDPSRVWAPGALGKMAGKGLSAASKLVGGRLSRGADESPADLAPGEGRVIRYRGKKLAVSRDEAGALHAVSPVCGHQGCIVNWNSAEQSWDCPCHGSRYAPTGEFIHGPTVRGLEPQEITK